MNSIENNVNELVKLVSHYKIKEALLRFYQDDFHAYENTEGPRIGIEKTLNRIETEKDEMDTLYSLDAKTWMVKGEKSMIHWVCEFKDRTGKYWLVEEVSIAKWADGKIYEDKYIYNMPVEIPYPSTETYIYKTLTQSPSKR